MPKKNNKKKRDKEKKLRKKEKRALKKARKQARREQAAKVKQTVPKTTMTKKTKGTRRTKKTTSTKSPVKTTKTRKTKKTRRAGAVRKAAKVVTAAKDKKTTKTKKTAITAREAAKSLLILVINPGSTSTKVAVYLGDKPMAQESIEHDKAEIEKYAKIVDQYPMRKQVVLDFLARHRIEVKSLKAVVDRGGLLKPISSGTYRVNDAMLADLRAAARGEHISNVGAFIAREIADQAKCEAFIVDAVSVDEFTPLARVSGLAGIERKSLLHALNMRMAELQACATLRKKLSDVNLIVAHLGGGISISPVDHGKFVDVNNANESGPFAPERAGGVPMAGLVQLCFSGKYTKDEIVKKLTRSGGLTAYLGTNSAKEVVARASGGDAKATEVLQAMCYQVAKEIGNCATVLKGSVDAIVITGGVAHNALITDWIKQRVGFITKNYLVFPGEDEMPALAAGALRVLRGEEKAREY